MNSDGYTRTRIANDRDSAISIVLEPWGEVYEMPAGDVYEIVADGPADDHLEVVAGEDRITVYGWSGSTIWVYNENGDDISGVTGERPRVPPIPTRSHVLG